MLSAPILNRVIVAVVTLAIPRLVSRYDWFARPPQSPLTRVDRFKRVALHYSTGQELGRRNTDQWVRNIQIYHQKENRWADIGYNFLVSAIGTIYEGRGWAFQGAHCPGRNHDSIGICFLGNDDAGVADVTIEAKHAIKYLIEQFAARFGTPVEIFPHSKYKQTACPGDELRAWIAAGLPMSET